MVTSTDEGIDDLLAQMAPRSLDAVVGQPEMVEALGDLMAWSQQREHPLPAVMLIGPGESGKRAIATALAMEIAGDRPGAVRRCDGASIGDGQSMRKLLRELVDDEVLVIDNIEGLGCGGYELLARSVREFKIEEAWADREGGPRGDRELAIYSAIVTAESEPESAGPSLEEQLTKDWISLRVVPYEVGALVEIAHRSAGQLGLTVTEKAAQGLVQMSGGLPERLQGVIAKVVLRVGGAALNGEINGAAIDRVIASGS